MRRSARVVLSLAVLLAGCVTRPVVLPAPPVVAIAPALSAVVVASRRLAPADLRAPVLQTLSGPAASGPPQPGLELVVQTADGRTLSCITHAAPPPRLGATVLLRSGPDCAPSLAGAHVAARGAIR